MDKQTDIRSYNSSLFTLLFRLHLFHSCRIASLLSMSASNAFLLSHFITIWRDSSKPLQLRRPVLERIIVILPIPLIQTSMSTA